MRELESARALHAQVSPTSWRVDSNLHDKRPCLETVERQEMGRFVFHSNVNRSSIKPFTNERKSKFNKRWYRLIPYALVHKQ